VNKFTSRRIAAYFTLVYFLAYSLTLKMEATCSCEASVDFQLTIYLSLVLQPFIGPWPLFQFLELFVQSVGLLGRGMSPSQGRYLHTEQQKQQTHTDIHT
jgi:hypothetical protein